MDWEIVGWKISFCSEDCICSEFLGLYYKWMVSLPEVENELLCRTSQTNWSPSETLGWSNWIFCTGNFPFIMVSGGQNWDMELSWEGFCKAVLGMLMFGCSSFPCPSRTLALTRTGIVCVCVPSSRKLTAIQKTLAIASLFCLCQTPTSNKNWAGYHCIMRLPVWQWAGILSFHVTPPKSGENVVSFFFPAPFFRRRSQVDDCFTGQSPGNAISIPAAPDVHEGLGQIQASAP